MIHTSRGISRVSFESHTSGRPCHCTAAPLDAGRHARNSGTHTVRPARPHTGRPSARARRRVRVRRPLHVRRRPAVLVRRLWACCTSFRLAAPCRGRSTGPSSACGPFFTLCEARASAKVPERKKRKTFPCSDLPPRPPMDEVDTSAQNDAQTAIYPRIVQQKGGQARSASPSRSSMRATFAGLTGWITPRSVMMPVISSAGVTSKAGL